MYEVHIEQSAERYLKRLPSDTFYRIASHIRSLANNPRPPRCVKIKGSKSDWRIRIGDYRVIYEVDDRERKVWVMRVIHRGMGYRITFSLHYNRQYETGLTI